MARNTRPAHRHAALIAAAQRAQLTAREVDDKAAPLATIAAGACTLRVRPTRSRIEALAKALDRAGKGTGARRIDGETRTFPKFAPGMSTGEYVKRYEAMNCCPRNMRSFYDQQQLNQSPATLYEGGQLDFDVIAEEIPEQLPTPAADVPAWQAPEVVDVHTLTAEGVRSWPAEQYAEAFEALEEINAHSECLALQALRVGTAEQVAEALAIVREHEAAGQLTADLYARRCALDAQLKQQPEDTPPAAPAVPALAITLTRAEGPAEECRRPVTVDSFTAADAVLRAWAVTAPARGGYDKCDITISWPAGGGYACRFDLQHADVAGPADLARHLVDTVAFYLGQACPEHLTAEQYLQYLASLPPATAAAYAEIRQQLQALGAWREVARPAAVDLGAMLRAGTVQPAQLVGVGVVFTGYRDQANNQPRSAGAIVSAEPTAYGLRLRVLLEDGREEWPDVSRDFRDCGHRPALYRVDWRAHGAPYLAQLQAARALAVATKSSAAELARRALDDERLKLAAKFPELERVGSGSSGHATAARNLRRLLTTTWPGVKFSVRSRSYSGGCSIDVEWTDGPACELVDEMAGRFEGGSFDGMTDSYTHRRTPWTELFGDADYVHTRRQLSAAAEAAIIAQEWGDSPDAPTPESLRAPGWGAEDARRRVRQAARTWSAPAPAGKAPRGLRMGRGGPSAPALA
jgi:hypothetical protein